MRTFFFLSREKELYKVKSRKTAAHLNRKSGTETLLCDVTVLLNIVVFLRYCTVLGEGFGPKYKPYFAWERAEKFVRCSADIIDLFFVVFLSNWRLATFQGEDRSCLYGVFFEYKLVKRERVSQQNSLPQYFVRNCLR